MGQAVHKRPQLRIDQESYDHETGLAFVRGWVLSDGPVKIRIYDDNKNRIFCSLHRENREDIRKAYPALEFVEYCGFYGEFPVDEGKTYYLAARSRGQMTIHRIFIQKSGKGRRIAEGLTGHVNKKIYSAAERAVQIHDYGVGGVVQAFLEKAKRIASRNRSDLTSWYDLIRTDEEELMKERQDPLQNGPLFRIFVTDSHEGTPGKVLLESLEDQTYGGWNVIGEAQEKGERPVYTLFCRNSDKLEPDALYRFGKFLTDHPETELIYSDGLRLSASRNNVKEIFLKPDYSPDFLCTTNYIGHVFAVSDALMKRAGSFPVSVKPEVAELDYLLRCIEKTELVGHVPAILYSWRSGRKHALLPAKEMIPVIRAHYRRTGFESAAFFDEKADVFRISLEVNGNPRISILIPSKDHVDDLRTCLDSIHSRSTWKNYEILIIENNSTEEKTFLYYDEIEKSCPDTKVLYYTERPVFDKDGNLKRETEKPFNYPELNNYAAEQAEGDYLLLLNNDTEVITADWLQKMLGYCQREDVGIVGAKLYYPDDTIQHAGVIVGLSGGAEHAGSGEPRNKAGYMKRYAAAQNLSAVTAACMMVRKSVYDEVGGLDPEYAVSFNDVDFCLRVRSAGYRIVYDADVELYHYESKSRGQDITKEQAERAMKELKLLQSRHSRIMDEGDPYYHPLLHPTRKDYSLADPEQIKI